MRFSKKRHKTLVCVGLFVDGGKLPACNRPEDRNSLWRMSDTPRLVTATLRLRERLADLEFRPPADFVYRPLDYAWEVHREYLERFAEGPKRVIFLGMNPGPYGMGQTGVPFGDVKSVRGWLRLSGPVGRPPGEHPGKLVRGFFCPRGEVSGARLWGLFAARFESPEEFFSGHYVHNYCPLLFIQNTRQGRNVTPEQLPRSEMAPVFEACDAFLRELVAVLRPEWVVGVGGFAARRAGVALAGAPVRIASIPHPSPANPGANKDWARGAERSLVLDGVWKD